MVEETEVADRADSARAHPRVTPGRIVMYSDGRGGEYPGVVTTVHDPDLVNVFVFPDGSYPGRDSGPQTSVQYDADGPESDRTWPTWRWPERVGQTSG